MNDVDTTWQALSDRIIRFAGRRLTDRDAAADIAQETITRALATFGPDADMATLARWSYRTARHLIIDRYRRRKSQSADLLEDVAAPGAASGDSTDAARPLGSCATAMLDHLDPVYRQAVVLADAEGLGQQAIAERLGMSLSGVKSRVQRGRAKLRGMLLDCCRIETDRRGNVLTCERTERSDAYCAA